MLNTEYIPTHINNIQVGDVVLHNGKESTVCVKDITTGFCGKTIFGDSYKSGTILVMKKYIPQFYKGKQIV